MRLAARYMRSRQLQKSSSPPGLRSARPAIARWNAWPCALARPGRAGPSSVVAPRRSAMPAPGTMRVQCPRASASSSTSCAQPPRTQASGAKYRRWGSPRSAGIERLAGDERRQHHLAHDRLDRRGTLLVVVERRTLAHVEVLAQLELHRVNVLGRAAVMPRDVAALEPAID